MWDTVEKILVGIVVVLLILWMRPGIKQSFEKSKQATKEDWRNLLLPLILVIAFVVFLISLA